MFFVEPDSPQMLTIRSILGRRVSFDPSTEAAGTVRIERGGVLADRVCGAPVGPIQRPDPVAPVIDAIGHTRPVYRGLLHYCLSLAGTDFAGHDSRGLAIDPGLFDRSINPAKLGSKITAAAWNALARRAADPHDTAAVACLRRIVANRSPDGPFLTPGSSDNPETFWYHDLILLHAVDAWADFSGDGDAAAAALTAAEYHQSQTQADHATAEPWGLPAFLKSPATVPTADALLHAVQSNQPDGPRGVTLLLLADTVYRSRIGGRAR